MREVGKLELEKKMMAKADVGVVPLLEGDHQPRNSLQKLEKARN